MAEPTVMDPNSPEAIVKYLSQRLTESHQTHSALLRERDLYRVQYEVLRDLALQMVVTWDKAGVGMMDDLNEGVQRLKDVLGLTSEPTQAPF